MSLAENNAFFQSNLFKEFAAKMFGEKEEGIVYLAYDKVADRLLFPLAYYLANESHLAIKIVVYMKDDALKIGICKGQEIPKSVADAVEEFNRLSVFDEKNPDIDKNAFSLLHVSANHLGALIEEWKIEIAAQPHAKHPDRRVFIEYEIPRGRIRGCSWNPVKEKDNTRLCSALLKINERGWFELDLMSDSVDRLCLPVLRVSVQRYNKGYMTTNSPMPKVI